MRRYLRVATRIFLVSCGVIVGLIVLLLIETQAAISQWNRVGGGVTDGGSQMTFGTAPGQPLSSDFHQIYLAARRLNGWPKYYQLSVSGNGLTGAQTAELIKGLHLTDLHIQDIDLDERIETSVLQKNSLRTLALGHTGSETLIRKFLESSPTRHATISRVRMSDEQRESLNKDFDDRLIDYDWMRDQDRMERESAARQIPGYQEPTVELSPEPAPQ